MQVFEVNNYSAKIIVQRHFLQISNLQLKRRNSTVYCTIFDNAPEYGRR